MLNCMFESSFEAHTAEYWFSFEVVLPVAYSHSLKHLKIKMIHL